MDENEIEYGGSNLESDRDERRKKGSKKATARKKKESDKMNAKNNSDSKPVRRKKQSEREGDPKEKEEGQRQSAVRPKGKKSSKAQAKEDLDLTEEKAVQQLKQSDDAIIYNETPNNNSVSVNIPIQEAGSQDDPKSTPIENEQEVSTELTLRQEGENNAIHVDALGYSGEFLNGIYSGKGAYVWPNGDRYIGDFKDGKRHGSCVYSFANGDVFNGKYKDDMKFGKGRYLYANGDIFEGTYLVCFFFSFSNFSILSINFNSRNHRMI